MKVYKRGLLVASGMIASTIAVPYELTTHALVTLYGLQMSRVADPAVQKELGIDIYNLPRGDSFRQFDTTYFDMGSELRSRKTQRYESGFMPKNEQFFNPTSDSLAISGWLIRGAIREDDTPIIDPLSNDDPLGDVRPLNHFFDPVHNVPLTSGGNPVGGALGMKNPDWALGTADAFSNPDAASELRRNHFSVFDAREAMWRALTLHDKNDIPVDSFDGMTKEAIRKAYWATTFRALGDLLHHDSGFGPAAAFEE